MQVDKKADKKGASVPKCHICGCFVSLNGLYYARLPKEKRVYLHASYRFQPEVYRESLCWNCWEESKLNECDRLRFKLHAEMMAELESKMKAYRLQVEVLMESELEKDIARREKSTAWGKQPEKAVNYNRNNRKGEV